MPKLLRTGAALLTVAVLVCLGGFVHARVSGGPAEGARPWMYGLLVCFGVMALAAAYMAAVGAYHTVLALFAGHHWRAIAWTPPGWAALLAQALSDARPLHALTPTLLLFLLGLGCSLGAHELSLREMLRPPEPSRAPASARAQGWLLPGLPASFSALLEKEAKTIVRVGWLQLVIVPVAYLLLVRTMFSGPQPLLIASVYAHLGVLEIATNAFGRDLAAARGYFLWPVPRRQLLAAKNAVAYCFSLAIFALLAGVAAASSRVTPMQVAVGALAHAAIFPLLATLGNVTSVLFPVPVRGARLRRVRGAGPVGARLLALAFLAAAAWAPYLLSQWLGLPLLVAYAGELLAMAMVYGGLLGFAAHLLESRREPLLASLARDE